MQPFAANTLKQFSCITPGSKNSIYTYKSKNLPPATTATFPIFFINTLPLIGQLEILAVAKEWETTAVPHTYFMIKVRVSVCVCVCGNSIK